MIPFFADFFEMIRLDPLNLFQEEYKTDLPPIRLSYHQGNHYNSVRDPLCPTAGVGLGFSDLKPGVCAPLSLFCLFYCFDKNMHFK